MRPDGRQWVSITKIRPLALVVALCACSGGSGETSQQEVAPPDSIVKVGILGGSETFGSIHRVVPFADGVLVLDRMNNRIHHFGLDGEESSRFGEGGQGPGEFQSPQAVAVSQDGAVYVLDSSNGRIAVLGIDSGEGLHWLGAIRLEYRAEDLCVLGSRLFLLSHQQGRMIHELSPSGEILQSFGEAVPENPVLKEFYAAGRLYCEPERRIIVHVPATFPQVQAFGADSEGLWRAELPEYHQTHYQFVAGGAIRVDLDDEGMAHSLRGVGILGRDTLLVQLTLSRGRSAPRSLESYLVSLVQGKPIGTLELPPVAASERYTRLYSPVEVPFPVLEIYERPRRK
jgi:hypothetical protein